MNGHIYLIGFMGTGKSTVSKELHSRLGLSEIDMDLYIESRQQMKISDLFQTYGEGYFRDLETAALREISQQKPAIISCGGGAVLRPENVQIMHGSGCVVQLTATPETVFERVRHCTHRPVLNGNMNVSYIRSLMEQRSFAYESACQIAVKTDGRTPEEIADEICGILAI